MKQQRIQNTQQKHNVRTPPPRSPADARDHWGYDRDDDDIPGQRQTPIQAEQQKRDAGRDDGQDDAIGNVQRPDQAHRAESRDGNRAEREQEAQERRQPTEAEQTREDIQRAEEEGMVKNKTENEPHHKASSGQARDRATQAAGRPTRDRDRSSSKHKSGKSSHRH